jgi:hypothetical protein
MVTFSSKYSRALTFQNYTAKGIDLSCASVAVFFELPPDCGWVQQAEDRLHRKATLSQKSAQK